MYAPAGFEPAIPACERPQNHALDRAAIGIGKLIVILYTYMHLLLPSLCITYNTEIFTKTKRNLRQVYEIRSGYVSLCTINPFLGAYAKLLKATISFVMSVRTFAWNYSPPTAWSFINFDI
jgi:hypothetical protein